MFIPWILYCVLGFVLFYSVRKEKVKGKLGFFLTLTGLSASSFLIFVVLHNFFYALAELTAEIFLLPYVMNFFEVVFFLLGVLGSPTGFIIGVVGSLVSFRKKSLTT